MRAHQGRRGESLLRCPAGIGPHENIAHYSQNGGNKPNHDESGSSRVCIQSAVTGLNRPNAFNNRV